MKYGEVVVLIQKSLDQDKKEVLSRVNALVLVSSVQPKDADPRKHSTLRGQTGVLPEGEYLDLQYLAPLPEGVSVFATAKTELVRFTGHTAPWKEGAWIGWEAPPSASAEGQKLRAFLLENFKKETGNETPEDCAIRLLSKKK